MEKKQKKIIYIYITIIAIFAFLLLTFGCTEKSNEIISQTEKITETKTQETSTPAQSENMETLAPTPTLEISDEQTAFEIHFIDVGQGDSILVLCDGKAALIDGGNGTYSSLIYSYLKRNNISELEYIIASHNDIDHIGGLLGALNYATAKNALANVSIEETSVYLTFCDYLSRQGTEIRVPTCGETFNIGSALVTVVGPQKQYEEPNNMSIALKITYGKTSFLLMGDAEFEEENDIISAGVDISADVIKIAHHGSEYSSSQKFLENVGAKVAIISCGEDNAYGHPATETLSRIESAGMLVYRTDTLGTIKCVSDGEQIIFYRVSTEQIMQNESLGYYGNVKSMIFHRMNCPNLPSEKNRIFFDTREEALRRGYTPCQNCNP